MGRHMDMNAVLTEDKTAGAQARYVSADEHQERVAARDRLEDSLPLPASEQLNPRMSRSLPAQGDIRSPLSSNRKKDLSRSKRAVFSKMPQSRRQLMLAQTEHTSPMERLNMRLAETIGDTTKLSSYEARRVRRLDRAISDIEGNNKRQHLVYTPLFAPGGDRQGLLDHFKETLEKNEQRAPEEQRTEDFDRYVVADHNIANLDRFPSEIVAEIRTTRGGYIGGSDTVAEAEHILPRGMRYKVVAVQEGVQYLRPDGSMGRRTVVQLEDINIDKGE